MLASHHPPTARLKSTSPATVSPRRQSNPPILWNLGDGDGEDVLNKTSTTTSTTTEAAAMMTARSALDAAEVRSVNSYTSTDSGCPEPHSTPVVPQPAAAAATAASVNGGKKMSTSSLLSRPFSAIVRKLSRNSSSAADVVVTGGVGTGPISLAPNLSTNALNSVSSLNITSTGGDSGVYGGGTLSSATTSHDHLERASANDVRHDIATSSASATAPASAAATSAAGYRRCSPPPSASKYIKHKFKFLPPPLKHMKKKSSCPSLFGPQDGVFAIRSAVPHHAQSQSRLDLTEDADDAAQTGSKSAGLASAHFFWPKDFDFDELSACDSSLCVPVCDKWSSSDTATQLSRGTRFRLLHTAPNVPVCKLEHSRSMLAKLGSSKLLRRWECHNLKLSAELLQAETATGVMQLPVPLSAIEDVECVEQFDSTERFCCRLFIADGSLLFKAQHLYDRQQWMLSINWRRAMLRFKHLFTTSDRPELILVEVMNLVRFTSTCQLQDELVYSEPVSYICLLLNRILDGELAPTMLEPIIVNIAPLLETLGAIELICPIFSQICRQQTYSARMCGVFENVAADILKRNMDLGNYRQTGIFVQEFLTCLLPAGEETRTTDADPSTDDVETEQPDDDDSESQPADEEQQTADVNPIRDFVLKVHSPAGNCPHGRVLPNLAGVCLTALRAALKDDAPSTANATAEPVALDDEPSRRRVVRVFARVLSAMCELCDWRTQLAHILQPLPFPDSAVDDTLFVSELAPAIRAIGTDPRCEVHLCVLGVRSGKCGWLDVYCPEAHACRDAELVFAPVLDRLLTCCCKRKNFVQSLTGMLTTLELLALRETRAAIEALCFMLEMDVIKVEEDKMRTIRALQSTAMGREQCLRLCDKMHALIEMQQRGGPSHMSLPSKSTDHDLAVFLSYGFGNLTSLWLAFTSVTSACADVLIRLPKLDTLNLWCTQFGDKGVQLISEHLEHLQDLNLCETPTTDKGLVHLAALKQLRLLNVNSTKLTQGTYLMLKVGRSAHSLQSFGTCGSLLQESLPDCNMDIAYTEAWPTR